MKLELVGERAGGRRRVERLDFIPSTNKNHR